MNDEEIAKLQTLLTNAGIAVDAVRLMGALLSEFVIVPRAVAVHSTGNTPIVEDALNDCLFPDALRDGMTFTFK